MAMKGYTMPSSFSPGNATNLCNEYLKLGVNSIRYMLINFEHNVSRSVWVEKLKAQVDKLNRISYAVGPKGLRFMCDYHHTYGMISEWSNEHYILEPEGFKYWVEDMNTILTLLKNNPYVFGFETVNEPWSKPRPYEKFLAKHWKMFRNMAKSYNKILYISPSFGLPRYLDYIPRTGGRLLCPTAHVWPAYSLRFEGQATERDLQIINSDRCLDEIKIIRKWEVANDKRILTGEVGCLKFVGEAAQREYMRRNLRYAVSQKMNVFVHGEHGNPVYLYENTGVWDVIANIYKKR